MNPPPPGASPVKKFTCTKTDTRKERSFATHKGRVALSTEDFGDLYLNHPLPKVLTQVTKKASKLRDSVQSATTEESGYNTIPLLLNQIEDTLYENVGYDSQLVFSSSPKQPPLHHPRGHRDVPDFHAMEIGLSRELDQLDVKASWHHLDSVGEWKPGMTFSTSEQSQAAAYAGSHNQARPDKPGVLVFSACRGGYIIGYSDPSIWTTTKQVEWNDLVPLISYVHSLHIPRSQFRDSTITLSCGPGDPPRWRIRDHTLNIDGNFRMIHTGRPHSRMTTVFEDVDTSNAGPLIIKDSYLNNSRASEHRLFQALGASPGWVNVRLRNDDPIEPLLTPNIDGVIQRRKDRTVMENTGAKFNDCKVLSEAVAAVYDILEADRWAITARRVLHRDISPGNILIRPVEDSPPCEGVCFIGGIFTGKPEQSSSAILLDLDNGTLLPKEPLSPSLRDIPTQPQTTEEIHLRAISGTPMYIARAPSKGYYEGDPHQFPHLPELRSSVRDRYIKAYPDDPFRDTQGAVGTTNQKMFEEFSGKQVIQRSWHDAESAVLTLLVFLLRCSPLGAEDEPDEKLQHMQEVYKNIRNTSIGSATDPRDLLFLAKKTTWSRLLHDDLAHLVNHVTTICAAVLPEYEFLQASNGINHEIVLHEVLQRLLFTLYCELKENPDLDVTFKRDLRPLRDDEGWKYSTSAIVQTSSKFAGKVDYGKRKADVDKSEYVEAVLGRAFARPGAFTGPSAVAGPSTFAGSSVAGPSAFVGSSAVAGPSGYFPGATITAAANLRPSKRKQLPGPGPPTKRVKKKVD